MAARGRERGGVDKMGELGQNNLPVIKSISPGEVMYSMVTKVTNTVLCI